MAITNQALPHKRRERDENIPKFEFLASRLDLSKLEIHGTKHVEHMSWPMTQETDIELVRVGG